jgi:hypothetical protein
MGDLLVRYLELLVFQAVSILCDILELFIKTSIFAGLFWNE